MSDRGDPAEAGATLPVVDTRAGAAFLAGHAPGAAHLPADAWGARAAELPPREAPFLIVAEDAATATARVGELVARGWRRAAVAPPGIAADRRECGPARGVAWRPSAWLETCATTLSPGARVLDLACGSGRNAVALAGHGARVIGLDLLPDALVRARELADHDPRGVHLAAHLGLVVADATRPLPFRLASFDVIAGFRYLDRALFAVLVPFLVPGGELWWETFGPGQARFGHPRRAEFLLGPGELPVLCAAAGLEVLAAQDHEDPGGAGPVLSAVRARRPMR